MRSSFGVPSQSSSAARARPLWQWQPDNLTPVSMQAGQWTGSARAVMLPPFAPARQPMPCRTWSTRCGTGRGAAARLSPGVAPAAMHRRGRPARHGSRSHRCGLVLVWLGRAGWYASSHPWGCRVWLQRKRGRPTHHHCADSGPLLHGLLMSCCCCNLLTWSGFRQRHRTRSSFLPWWQ